MAWSLAIQGEDSKTAVKARAGDVTGTEMKNEEIGNMASGIVKFFNDSKGYGFIAPEEGGQDVFVHISDIQSSGIEQLKEDDAVDFDLGDGRDGRSKAINLSMSLVE